MINISFWNIAFTVINLLILFVAVRIFFFKPIADIIAKRQEEADEKFNEASKKEEEAAQCKQEYEGKLQSAEEEKKQILAEARKNADVAYQQTMADAKADAAKTHDQMLAAAEQEKREIIGSAKKEIADMVIEATGKVVGSQSGASVDSDLLDQFLGKAGE